MTQPMIHAIPTHIIVGFLGAGKTTLLNHLLAQKPAQETWAVLVNEAGQVEIDATLIVPPEHADNGSIAIKQVIGGCMCCTNHLPMQIALSRLLSQSKPDRLFIEATGLAHAAQLIQQLSGAHWATALSLRAVLTVINGTNLHDPRLLKHENFQAQIANADIIILSHADVMQPADEDALQQLIQQGYYQEQPLIYTAHGKVLLDQIDVPHVAKLYKARPHKAKTLSTVYKAVKS